MTKPDVALLGFLMDSVVKELETFARVIPADTIATLPATQRSAITCAVSSAVHGARPDLLELLPNLTHIVSAGAGRDRYDMADLGARGIHLGDTGALVSSDTAEMAVALLLAVARDLVRADDHVRSGRWAGAHFGHRTRVAGKTAGLVGLGRIGQLIAARLTGLGVKVVYHTRHPKTDAPWQHEPDLIALADRADFLVVAVPGGDTTRQMINAPVLKALGPKGFLINISRGTVVDEDALIAALGDGTVAGAALDVFENEPSPDVRFNALPNILMTPHIATITEDFARELAVEIARQVAETLS